MLKYFQWLELYRLKKSSGLKKIKPEFLDKTQFGNQQNFLFTALFIVTADEGFDWRKRHITSSWYLSALQNLAIDTLLDEYHWIDLEEISEPQWQKRASVAFSALFSRSVHICHEENGKQIYQNMFCKSAGECEILLEVRKMIILQWISSECWRKSNLLAIRGIPSLLAKQCGRT